MHPRTRRIYIVEQVIRTSIYFIMYSLQQAVRVSYTHFDTFPFVFFFSSRFLHVQKDVGCRECVAKIFQLESLRDHTRSNHLGIIYAPIVYEIARNLSYRSCAFDIFHELCCDQFTHFTHFIAGCLIYLFLSLHIVLLILCHLSIHGKSRVRRKNRNQRTSYFCLTRESRLKSFRNWSQKKCWSFNFRFIRLGLFSHCCVRSSRQTEAKQGRERKDFFLWIWSHVRVNSVFMCNLEETRSSFFLLLMEEIAVRIKCADGTNNLCGRVEQRSCWLFNALLASLRDKPQPQNHFSHDLHIRISTSYSPHGCAH